MGKEQRAKEAARAYRMTIPGRCLKAVLGFFLLYLLMPFVFAKMCYQKNEWPWDKIGE